MELPDGLDSLAIIILVAALAPLILSILPGPRIPEVAVLIVAGVVLGPHVLDVVQTGSEIGLIANVGLGFLFFLAGYELDLAILRGRAGANATASWIISFALALAIVGGLYAAGFVKAFLPVSIALTTTALGTLLPMLRDSGENKGPLGVAVLANGAVGEFLPIIAISVFLSTQGAWKSIVILVGFGLLAWLITRFGGWMRTGPIAEHMRRGADTSSQTTVRITVLLLVTLLALSGRLGLDIVLGAFSAGIVMRATVPEGDRLLERKLEAIGFGLFIPVFFVVSGSRIDVQSIIDSPARMLVFFVLILVVRGVPAAILHRRSLPGIRSVRLGLYTATGLPLIVAISEIGLSTGVMLPQNAAALVGAGLLTVLVLPFLARVLASREEPGAEGAGTDSPAPQAS